MITRQDTKTVGNKETTTKHTKIGMMAIVAISLATSARAMTTPPGYTSITSSAVANFGIADRDPWTGIGDGHLIPVMIGGHLYLIGTTIKGGAYCKRGIPGNPNSQFYGYGEIFLTTTDGSTPFTVTDIGGTTRHVSYEPLYDFTPVTGQAFGVGPSDLVLDANDGLIFGITQDGYDALGNEGSEVFCFPVPTSIPAPDSLTFNSSNTFPISSYHNGSTWGTKGDCIVVDPFQSISGKVVLYGLTGGPGLNTNTLIGTSPGQSTDLGTMFHITFTVGSGFNSFATDRYFDGTVPADQANQNQAPTQAGANPAVPDGSWPEGIVIGKTKSGDEYIYGACAEGGWGGAIMPFYAHDSGCGGIVFQYDVTKAKAGGLPWSWWGTKFWTMGTGAQGQVCGPTIVGDNASVSAWNNYYLFNTVQGCYIDSSMAYGYTYLWDPLHVDNIECIGSAYTYNGAQYNLLKSTYRLSLAAATPLVPDPQYNTTSSNLTLYSMAPNNGSQPTELFWYRPGDSVHQSGDIDDSSTSALLMSFMVPSAPITAVAVLNQTTHQWETRLFVTSYDSRNASSSQGYILKYILK